MAVPRTFLLLGPRLGLKANEMLLVLELVMHKWDESNPYPGAERLARRMNVSVAQVRKLARQLEKEGMLRHHPRRTDVSAFSMNEYDLSPLFAKLATASEAVRQFSARPRVAERSRG